MSVQSIVTEMIPLASIEIAPNVRTATGLDKASIRELAESLKEHGLMQPIYVAKTEDGKHVVIAGQRRTLAAIEAGWTDIPAIVSAGHDGEDLKAKQIIENLHRENLSLAETCQAVREMLAMVGKPKEVGRRLNKSPAWVSKHLSPTDPKFSDYVRTLIATGGCNDLESALMLNQIQKHERGGENMAAALGAKVAAGEIGRAAVRAAMDALNVEQPGEDEGGDEGEGDGEAVETFGKLELAERPAKLILQALEAQKRSKNKTATAEELDALISHVSDFILKKWPKLAELVEQELPM